MGHFILVCAGFSDEMSTLAILGRDGFFDNFSIQFDPCGTPGHGNSARLSGMTEPLRESRCIIASGADRES